jgi:Outer membrane efflux protein
MLTGRRISLLLGRETALSSYGGLVPQSGTRRLQPPGSSRVVCWLLLAWVARPALASALDPPLDLPVHPAHAAELPTADTGSPLSLDEASSLALVDQPILSGREAVINADERQAVAAAQLPDPKLSGGLKELPIDTGEAFSIRRDNFTQFTVGLSQALPRAEKRRLRGERKRLEADTERAALHNDQRALRRDASLAWLDVYEAEQGLALARQLTSEAALQARRSRRTTATARRRRRTGRRRTSRRLSQRIRSTTGCTVRCECGPSWPAGSATPPSDRWRAICRCPRCPAHCRNSWQRSIIIR